MSYIKGFDRTQAILIPETIDQLIDRNNPVRFIDAFVDSLDIVGFGFKDISLNKNGRPPFDPNDLLKLYIYGYLNKIRSSRGLEKEAKRNIELIWLMTGLVPDHNTISNFRRDNPKAIKKVFRATVNIAKNLDLIGGILLAGDGTKLRAQNSKKNNYNQKKIDRHPAYIETKLAEYCKALETADGDTKKEINAKIDTQNKHKKQYQK
ncbi:MAG: transposase [Flavobacteriales bacterium]|nr:transposase [Flavobacteriales bacterium]